jgi:hypothetical protein
LVPTGRACASTLTPSPSGSAAVQRTVTLAETAPDAGSTRKSRIDGARFFVA